MTAEGVSSEPAVGTIAVVIPTRNRPDRLPRLVAAVLDQADPAPAQIVIVDDASDVAAGEVLGDLAAADPRLLIVRLDRQSGPAVARNRGWRVTMADAVAFTDDDCLPQPGWLRHLTQGLAAADVVQGQTAIDPASPVPNAYDRWIEISEFSHYFESCNIAYRRPLLEKLDGFDEAFGFSRGGAPNGEDIDLGWRGVEAGARTSFASGALVYHPVTRMGFLTRLRSQLRSARMAYTVRRHPGLRAHLPHHYFADRTHPPALVALAALGISPVLPLPWAVPVAACGFVPYLRCRLGPRRVTGRRRNYPVTMPATFLIDLFDVGVLAVASVRWRTVLL